MNLKNKKQEALKPSSVLTIQNRILKLTKEFGSYKYSGNKFLSDRNKFLLEEIDGHKILGIGASEVGILLTSPYELFCQKVLGQRKEYSREMLYKFEDAKDSESRILKRFLDSEVNTYEIKEVSLNKYKNGSDKHTYFRKDNSFIKATIDGHMSVTDGSDYILEFKNTNDFDLIKAINHFNETGDYSDTMSMFKYYSQVQASMYSTGIKKALLLVQYTGKSGVYIHKAEVNLDADFLTYLLFKVSEYKRIVLSYLNGDSLENIEAKFKEMLDRRIKEKAFSFENISFTEDKFNATKEIKEEYEGKLNALYKELEEKLSSILSIDLSNTKKNLIGTSLSKLLSIRKDSREIDYRKKLSIETRNLRKIALKGV